MSDSENNSAIAQKDASNRPVATSATSSPAIQPSAYPDTAGIVTNRNDQRDPGDENPESAVEMPGHDAEPGASIQHVDVGTQEWEQGPGDPPAGNGLVAEVEAVAAEVVAEVETVAAAIETEAKKVWNNTLQAWV